MADKQWGDIYYENKQKVKYFPVHVGQRDLLTAKARFVAAIAGSGSGKTAGGCLWFMNEIQQAPTDKFLLVTPTFKILRSATLPAWRSTVEGTDLEGEYKVADSEYICGCGAKIYLRSAEEPRSIQGCIARACWADEGGMISKEAWDTILQRVGYRRGRVLVTTTPYSHNFLFKEFYARWRKGDKDYYVRQFPSTLNPTYPAEEYERARQTLPAHKFAMLYNGQFQRAAGLVYPDLDKCVVDKPKSGMPEGRLVGGIDFGYNDPFAALAGVLDKDDVLWLFYERYKRQTTLEEHAANLPRSVEWFCDSSRPDSIRDLKRLEIFAKPCRKGSGSLDYGLGLVHQRIKEKRLKIIRGTCQALLEEAETYHYPSNAGSEETYGDRPDESTPNHAADCLRYLITSIDRKKRGD